MKTKFVPVFASIYFQYPGLPLQSDFSAFVRPCCASLWLLGNMDIPMDHQDQGFYDIFVKMNDFSNLFFSPNEFERMGIQKLDSGDPETSHKYLKRMPVWELLSAKCVFSRYRCDFEEIMNHAEACNQLIENMIKKSSPFNVPYWNPLVNPIHLGFFPFDWTSYLKWLDYVGMPARAIAEKILFFETKRVNIKRKRI